MDEQGVAEQQVGSSSSAWSALIIGAISGVVPLVLSAGKYRAEWENGQLKEFHYRDNIALFGGLAALVCGAVAIYASRRPSATRTKLIVAGAALVLLGGFHAARGMGAMQDPPANAASTVLASHDEPIDAEPRVTPATCPDAKACNELGRSLDETDEAGALEAFVRGCELGGSDSCADAGGMLYDGLGAPADKARAATFYEQACTMGLARSCAIYGELLYNGDGIPKDTGIAVTFFQKACDAHNGLGCYDLAAARKDAGYPAEAQQGFVAACELGRGDACNVAGGALVKKDPAAARALFEKACATEEAQRCYNLGVFYEHGNGGLKQDAAKARELYERGCAADDALSCNNLGHLHDVGLGGPADVEQARLLFQRACDLGSKLGCENLATLPDDQAK